MGLSAENRRIKPRRSDVSSPTGASPPREQDKRRFGPLRQRIDDSGGQLASALQQHRRSELWSGPGLYVIDKLSSKISTARWVWLTCTGRSESVSANGLASKNGIATSSSIAQKQKQHMPQPGALGDPTARRPQKQQRRQLAHLGPPPSVQVNQDGQDAQNRKAA